MPLFDPSEMARWSEGEWIGSPPAGLDGVSNDTRTLKAGSLYIALKGASFDGHAFVEEAFRKGAGGAMVSRAWSVPSALAGKALLRVEDTARALCQVAAAYRLKIAPRMVAITGSVGKSTVKEMTTQILASAFPTAGTKGNWNNDVGLPLSLLAMGPATRAGVFEMGTNHPGELAPLCGLLKPDYGVVTNVGPVHIEFFGSVEAIAEEKATLLRCLPSGGVAVLNRDDSYFEFFCSCAPGRVTTVSLQGKADYVCLSMNPPAGEATLRERESGETFAFRMPVRGAHNIANAMLAVAVAREFGLGWEQIRGALRAYAPLPMRGEEKTIAGITLINDAYNANPLSMRASLQAFGEEPARGAKWLILGGMRELGNRQDEEHTALGRLVGEGNWAGLIAVGPLGRLIALGAEEAGFGRERVLCCENNEAAAQAVMDNLKPGDSALLKASRGIRLEEIVATIEKTKRGTS